MLKQQVKAGKLSIKEAIKQLEAKGRKAIASKTYQWLVRRFQKSTITRE